LHTYSYPSTSGNGKQRGNSQIMKSQEKFLKEQKSEKIETMELKNNLNNHYVNVLVHRDNLPMIVTGFGLY
jgi:hypothetical protein